MKYDLLNNKKTLTEILKEVKEYDEIILDNRDYFEKITITTPNLTLVGRGNTRIIFNASNGTIIPLNIGGDGIKTFGTTGSATVTIKPSASGFKAQNITFENSFDRLGKKNGQAVAFKSECSNLVIDGCRFIGYQDTLYIDYGTNNQVINSYICGDVDFIFGSADCDFINCTIKALNAKTKEAYYTAPDTYVNNKKGFIFTSCKFLAKDMITYLGRPWFPSLAVEPIYPKVTFINCEFPKNINMYMKRMHDGDPDSFSCIIKNCKEV